MTMLIVHYKEPASESDMELLFNVIYSIPSNSKAFCRLRARLCMSTWNPPSAAGAGWAGGSRGFLLLYLLTGLAFLPFCFLHSQEGDLDHKELMCKYAVFLGKMRHSAYCLSRTASSLRQDWTVSSKDHC